MPPDRRLYFDNAATSFPKPVCVHEAMADFATRLGASPGRGAYTEASEAGELLWRCREAINELIGGESAAHVVFTLNTSDALNLGIRGLVHSDGGGDAHIITTAMDHNSVLRPFNALCERLPVSQTRVPCDPASGIVDPDDVRRAIRPNTRLIAAVHASNVSGSIQPIGEIGRLCRERQVPLLVDAAQSLGHFPVNVRDLNIDLLAFPGHKGLLGPLGTGGLYIRPGLELRLQTVREGGTGSASEQDTHPLMMPDKYEPGSHNAIGIIGLGASVRWILDRGIESIAAHEQRLMRLMLSELGLIQGSDRRSENGLRLYGPTDLAQRVGVFAFTIDGVPHGELATVLESRYGILARSGLHCAPHAHRTLGTMHERRGGSESGGAVRLSLGPFLTDEDVRYAASALREIAREFSRHVLRTAT